MYKLVSLFGVIISIWYLVQYITTNGVVFPVVLFGHSSHFAFCLTICFTVCLYTQKSIQSSEKVIFSIMAYIIAITLLLLNSRLGALFSFAIMLRDLFHWKYKNILFVSFFCAIILAVYYKTDSSNGRLFIYMQSILMAQEKPFLGWGNGGFAANYMKWQASYFASNPDSPYVLLADNIHHPLSEFLLVLTNFGLVGLCVLICVFFSFSIHDKYKMKRQNLVCNLFLVFYSFHSFLIHFKIVY